MAEKRKVKIAIIGAGSVIFCPATVGDILLSEPLCDMDVEVALMDIDAHALEVSGAYAKEANARADRGVDFWTTLVLDDAVRGADFVITAIEVERYHYWSMDFHIPRRYGFRQVYGENGGPGGMFHMLRNLPPMLEIAHRMEELCPDALLINYTNPEAKLVEAITKLTRIKAVGVCHGYTMGAEQIARILGRPLASLRIEGHGLNHFGFMTKVEDRETGEDLYPAFRQKEREAHWLAEWDELGLSRMMYRTYGLWPYPGTNHIGEYIAWSDEFLASAKIQYFFDPVREDPWATHTPPRFIYSFSGNPTGIEFESRNKDREDAYEQSFSSDKRELRFSGEYGILIIEAVLLNSGTVIPSLNVANHQFIPGLLEGMCVEGPCRIDAQGVHPVPVVKPLPAALSAMINQQGSIHALLIQAYVEKSRNKLLQAILLDPTISTYHNAVALIDEMFGRQAELLPQMTWKDA